MAKSTQERVKEFRKRNQMELAARPDSTYPFLAEPFHLWLERTNGGRGDWGTANEALDAAGFDGVEITDDLGPRSRDGIIERAKADGFDHYDGYAGAIGQAESIVDNLIVAAQSMAMVIMIYKIEMIEKRIAELEQADLGDPDVRKAALAEAVKLNKMREALQKRTKINFYQWKVKGI